MKGCESDLAQRVCTNLTLYLVHLAPPDVAFHGSDLLSGFSDLTECQEAHAANMLLHTLSSVASWPDPEKLESLDSIEPLLGLVQGVLDWLGYVSGEFNTAWPIFALLSKIHHVVLQFVTRIHIGDSGFTRLLYSLLYLPHSAPTFSLDNHYLRAAWVALQEDDSVPERVTAQYLHHASSPDNANGRFAQLGMITALLALADCCSARYPDSADMGFQNLWNAMSLDIFFMPWPVWSFADRISIPRFVHIKSTIPYALAVLPRREKVSDFVRACQYPYCDHAFFRVAGDLWAASGGLSLRVGEVGSNLGDCSMHLLGMGLAQHATLFEPIPALVECLQATISYNAWDKMVDLISQAAGPSVGVEELVLTGRRHGNWAEVGNRDVYQDDAGIENQFFIARPAPRFHVARTRVDMHIHSHVDLLKIFVPGKSLDVLLGAKQILGKVRAIYLTIQPAYMNIPHSDLRALLIWLAAEGFTVDVVHGIQNVTKDWVSAEVLSNLTHRLAFSIVAWRDLFARGIHAPWLFEFPPNPGCTFDT